MEVRRLHEAEIPTLVDDLWFPLAEEMADLDAYNELADDVRDDVLAHRRERFAIDTVATFVAADGTPPDASLVGYAAVGAEDSPPVFARGPEATIKELYVAPDHRGEGLATRLMQRAETWAADQGCERTTLSVNARNEHAIEVYESRGYEVRRLKMDRRLD